MTPPSRSRLGAHVVRRRAAARLLASLVLAASANLGHLALGPLDGSPALAATGPLPACRYDDILTAPRGYDHWAATLVDTILRVPRSYVPPDLTTVGAAGLSGSAQVRALLMPDLTEMASAAKTAGNPLGVASAYRSYTTQQTVFQGWVNKSGLKLALLYSARPGHSEHQLGLAIDFKSAGGTAPWDGPDWGQSPAGSWLRLHAWEYGFIQSYPKGKRATTCYDYESWHFRYVGRDEAAAIHASGLTLREYLWANFTTASVPGASGAPQPSSKASAAPSEATTEPSPSLGAPASAIPSASASAQGSSPGPSDGDGSGGPVSSAGPLEPAGTWFGLDPSIAAAIALVALVAALVVTLGTGRAGRRRTSRGMGQKSRDGP